MATTARAIGTRPASAVLPNIDLTGAGREDGTPLPDWCAGRALVDTRRKDVT